MRLYRLQFGDAERPDFHFELFPLHSPLLGESLLVSFPPLNYMLKSSGSSCLISGPKVCSGGCAQPGRAGLRSDRAAPLSCSRSDGIEYLFRATIPRSAGDQAVGSASGLRAARHAGCLGAHRPPRGLAAGASGVNRH